MERVPTFWTPTLSLMLSLIWDRSNEAHPSSPFHLLHLSPSMARLRATLHLLQWTFKVKPSCVSPPLFGYRVCCLLFIDWLLHVHLLAYMLCIYHHHQLPSMHNHLICLCDAIIVAYPLRTIVSPLLWHLLLWYGRIECKTSLVTHISCLSVCMWGYSYKSL